MRNMENQILVQRYTDPDLRGEPYQSSMTEVPALSYVEEHTYRRPGKRQRPKVFSISANTESFYRIERRTLLQKGMTGPMGSWIPYAWSRFATYSPLGLVGYSDSEIDNIIPLDELRPVIQNKILSDVVSGKAQLAVDLVELKKTKSMFAEAGLSLFQAFRDVRAGRPLRQFALAMQREGFSGLAGRKWLEFIYGWAPTVSGAFDTAEVLSQELQKGIIVRGKVRARTERTKTRPRGYDQPSYEGYCKAIAKGSYEYTVRDPKLLRLSQLGFTNPLAITWELLPWSFVLDWFVDVGGYINRMDFALGIENFWWQYSCFQQSRTILTVYEWQPWYVFSYQPAKLRVDIKRNLREQPTSKIVNTFRGFKRFTNETVRLTSAVALINQQRQRLKSLSLTN